jgi:hypothetical protein
LSQLHFCGELFMKTAIFRGIIFKSITILSILVLLSGCGGKGGGDSEAKAEDTNLTNLVLSSGTLTPNFDANTTSYTAQVASNVSTISVTMTTANSSSTITVNGQAVSSGVGSQPIGLSVGANTITIVVTAKDDKTTKTYTVVITRSAAPIVTYNADLAGIILSTGSSLSPSFTASTTSYTAQVDNSVTSLTITPTVADSTSTITVNGQAVSSGAASKSITLSEGSNTITIVVTAKDKNTTKTYTVLITRAVLISHNANLSGLSLPYGCGLSPFFTSATTSYTGFIPDNVLSISITPTATVSSSTITVNGQAVSSGAGSQPINLSSVSTLIIVVRANDGSSTKTYTVSIERIRAFLWVAGNNTVNQSGVYGVTHPSVGVPGGRTSSISWIDSNNNLWLFGGWGYDSVHNSGYYLNDLWVGNFDNNGNWTWTWTSGDNPYLSTYDPKGVYGTQGVPAPGNKPGAREGSISWRDSSNLWLFGGYGYDSEQNLGYLNDLWRFNINTLTWTWVSGSNTANQYGVYGVTHPSVGVPGSRASSVSWRDNSGNLWLFGGWGYDSIGESGGLNDLWKGNFDNNGNWIWTWVSGNNAVNVSGTYGNKGVATASNMPGGRDSSVSWIDSNNNLWLFGGRVYASAGVLLGCRNDLWRFDTNTTTWTWVSGDNSINQIGVYNNAVPANNKPGARWGSISWIDSSGGFWLFGGSGYDGVVNENGYLTDLWKFDGINWTWVYGSNTVNRSGVYGGATSINLPGGRASSVSWIDSNNNLWFFGGFGYDSTTNIGTLNDLWEYKVKN